MDSIIDSVDMNLSKLREIVKNRQAWCPAVHEQWHERKAFLITWAAVLVSVLQRNRTSRSCM